MIRTLMRILVVVMALGVVPCTSHADKIDWGQRWELTPLEQKRLRAKGLSDTEVFVVANIQRKTGLDVDFLVHGVYRGVTLRQAGIDLGLTDKEMLARRPEWGTPAWEEAVKRGDPFWHPPTSRRSGGSPLSADPPLLLGASGNLRRERRRETKMRPGVYRYYLL